MRIKKLTHRAFTASVNIFRKKNPKIFCIGFNKTGTTSIEVLLKNCGVLVGNQRKAELLTESYLKGDVSALIKYCRSARGFQDVPFSLPETYKVLDKFYPESKFILTVRDDPEQWYRSVTNFSKKLHGKMPDLDDMKRFRYVNEGWAFRVIKLVYGDDIEKDWFNKEIRIQAYLKHIEDAQNYFSGTGRLCLVNVAKNDDFEKLIQFLGIPCKLTKFPLANKT